MDPDVVVSICRINLPSKGSGRYEVLNLFHSWHVGLIFIAAYILSPLLSQYYCLHIVNLFVLSISYDAIPYLMSSSFYSILSVSSVVAQFIPLHHPYVHKPVLILVICFTYLLSMSHTVSFHITCVYSLLE